MSRSYKYYPSMFKRRRGNRKARRKLYSFNTRIRRYDDIGNFSFYKKINGNSYHGYICTEWQFYNKYIKHKLGLNDYYSPGRTYLEYTYYLHK